MKSDNQKPQVAYFRRSLIDGLTPFRYRSRVRSLLGIPVAEQDKLSGCTVLPPVGFRYGNQPIYAGLHISTQLTEAIASENFSSQMSNNRRKLDKLYLEPDQQATPANHLGGLFKDKVENIGAPKDSMRYEGSSESFEAESSGNNISIERMEIPGISDNKKSCSPLFQSEEEVSLLAKKDKQVHQHKKTSPGKKIKEIGTPKLESKIGSQNYKEKQVEGQTEPVSSKAISKNKAFSQLQKTFLFKKKEVEQPQLELNLPFSEHRNFNLTTRSSSEAADKIEQIRHTVHEIAKKRSVQTKEKTSETNQQSALKKASSPPPSQPVIIYKQTSYKAKAPCAFWERSYLNRINIRTLR